MNLIDRAKMLWRHQSRYHNERDLTLRDDAKMLAMATEERIMGIEDRLKALESKANGTGGRAFDGAANG